MPRQAGLFTAKFGFKSNKAASEEAASAEAGPSSIDFLEDVVEIPGLQDSVEIPGLDPSQSAVNSSNQQAVPGEPTEQGLQQPSDQGQEDASSGNRKQVDM